MSASKNPAPDVLGRWYGIRALVGLEWVPAILLALAEGPVMTLSSSKPCSTETSLSIAESLVRLGLLGGCAAAARISLRRGAVSDDTRRRRRR
jgi:hypothetical protein